MLAARLDNQVPEPNQRIQPAPPPSAATPVGGESAARWWPVALIPLLALLAFAPGVHNGYVHWDDTVYIRDNPLLVQPGGLWRIWSTLESPQYYPLTFSSYWAEYHLWGPWPTGYFITNVLLHAVNSVLVFLVLPIGPR